MSDLGDGIPRLPDGTVDTSADLGSAFDDVMDVIHSGYSLPTDEPDAATRETLERAERGYWDSLQREVGARMALSGVAVVSHQPPPEKHADIFDRELSLVTGQLDRIEVLLPKSLTRDEYGLLSDEWRQANIDLIVKSVRAALTEYERRKRMVG